MVSTVVIQRHNEIRNCIGDMATQMRKQVVREPVLREADVHSGDLCVCVCVCVCLAIPTEATVLYLIHNTTIVLESGAQEKKQVYKQVVEDVRVVVTPTSKIMAACISDK